MSKQHKPFFPFKGVLYLCDEDVCFQIVNKPVCPGYAYKQVHMH